MLTLYLAPGASSMAAHIALREIGAPFEIRSLSFARQEQRTPEFLAINAEGKVPALVTDGGTITEVAAILFYLARRFPGARLLPQGDLEAEARAISWMSYAASALHPARQRGLELATPIYALADRRLGGREWAIGESYSIADIHLFRLFWRFRNALHPPDGSFPQLSAHHDRVMARPAVQETIEVESAIGYELS